MASRNEVKYPRASAWCVVDGCQNFNTLGYKYCSAHNRGLKRGGSTQEAGSHLCTKCGLKPNKADSNWCMECVPPQFRNAKHGEPTWPGQEPANP